MSPTSCTDFSSWGRAQVAAKRQRSQSSSIQFCRAGCSGLLRHQDLRAKIPRRKEAREMKLTFSSSFCLGAYKDCRQAQCQLSTPAGLCRPAPVLPTWRAAPSQFSTILSYTVPNTSQGTRRAEKQDWGGKVIDPPEVKTWSHQTWTTK